jgi:hypothetical protein
LSRCNHGHRCCWGQDRTRQSTPTRRGCEEQRGHHWLVEALTVNPNERAWRPETLRLRGEIRRQQGKEEPAEADFRDAIALAREMSAKAWQLRAVMSLARLWRDQGKRAEARDLLAPVYGWFTEGFDTADLRDAAALLAELG